ncbi:acyl-homoserine-lactone synthase [Vibrio paucivorans]|uniref:Acyl-homoserine-lactone synthase n=1 Tax=Vibrio paucivorans TaxID=2829489 RepID=A0A9X3CDE7_9VIBR|nr:acyl-homoserine-lactone synthase [Vibrio paucivorans]MCW8333728.1 GNAT family N-acetyltransferase [Vibrio paucivorans]
MSISILSHTFSEIPTGDYDDLLSLRYKVFAKRLNWELNVEQQKETDEYDVDRAHYLYAKQEHGPVIGCWRVLPTTQDYMLKDTFPILLGEQEAPQEERVFELSRFAVDKEFSAQAGGVSNVTMKMFQALYQHAKSHEIDSYVTVTSVAIEKLISRMGIPNSRIGDQQVHLLGDTRSVVLHIPMNEQYKQSVGA